MKYEYTVSVWKWLSTLSDFLGAVVYFYFAFNYTGVTQVSPSSEFIFIGVIIYVIIWS